MIDAVFSLFPFPNNPLGIYGANTLTQRLPAGGQGKVFSGKTDGNFSLYAVGPAGQVYDFSVANGALVLVIDVGI